MIHNTLNFIGFQVCWFACVLGAASGLHWAGVMAVSVWVITHLMLALSKSDPGYSIRSEITLLIVAALVGYLLDSLLTISGCITFIDDSAWGRPSTLWMTAMWVNFATTLNHSMSWAVKHPYIGIALGFVGGPLAYWAGHQFGAIQLAKPMAASLTLIAIEWATAMALFTSLTRKINPFTASSNTLKTESAEASL